MIGSSTQKSLNIVAVSHTKPYLKIVATPKKDNYQFEEVNLNGSMMFEDSGRVEEGIWSILGG